MPVVNFAAGGVATPADAALMMQLGMDGVFVGSGIFKSSEPTKRAKAIVEAVANYEDPKASARPRRRLGVARLRPAPPTRAARPRMPRAALTGRASRR